MLFRHIRIIDIFCFRTFVVVADCHIGCVLVYFTVDVVFVLNYFSLICYYTEKENSGNFLLYVVEFIFICQYYPLKICIYSFVDNKLKMDRFNKLVTLISSLNWIVENLVYMKRKMFTNRFIYCVIVVSYNHQYP